MQVSVSSAASASTSVSAPSSSVKAGQSAVAQGQAGATSTDSFEQVYQHQDTSAAQANNPAVENGEATTTAIADDLAGQTEPLSQPQLEQLAQWLQTQPDPAKALEQLMQQLGFQQGQSGELPQQLTTILAQLRGESGLSFAQATTPRAMSEAMVGGVHSGSANVITSAADSALAEAGHELTSTSLNLRAQANPSVTLLESLQQAFSAQGLNAQNPNLQGLHALTQQMMSTAAMQQAAASSSETQAVPTQQLHASVDVSSPEWGKELVDQLRARMAFTKQESVQHAYVRLDPPELGKLEVSIRLDGDKASVHFTAAHPQLREALAANADRLRMDFDGSALDLVDVSVSSGMQQQSQSQGQAQQGEMHIAANEVAPTGVTIPAYALGSRFESMV